LELVHQDVLVARPIASQHVGLIAEEQDGVHQQVVEVAGVVLAQQFVVAQVGAAHLFVAVVARLVLGRPDQFILGRRDAAEQGARSHFLGVEVQLGDDLAHDAELVVGVEDHVVAAERGVVRLEAQDARADRMEGADAQPVQLAGAAEQPDDAVLHLAGGFIGEGHGQDMPGAHAPLLHQVGDAVGQDARLAAAWPGQHEHRAIARAHRLALLGIHAAEDLRGSHPACS